MKADWLSDARKIPDEVMTYIRLMAVRAVEEKHYSPELIADILGMSRSSIYEWLQGHREGGEAALETRKAPGASPVITPTMDLWLQHIVLNSTPVDHGYDTGLCVVECNRNGSGLQSTHFWDHIICQSPGSVQMGSPARRMRSRRSLARIGSS